MSNKALLVFIGLLGLFIFGMFSQIPQQGCVTFSSWGSDSEISILKPMLAEFEKENPDIKINFMHIPQNYFQKIHLLFSSKTSPDVIFLNNLYLPIYANAGVLEDLTPHCDELECEKFYPQALDSLTFNGKIYGIPRDISNMIIFYNKDLFAKYNIPFPKDNWTMTDFLLTAKNLTHQPKLFGISFEEKPLYYLPFMTSMGGWTKEDTREYCSNNILDKKANKLGLETYASLRKLHYAPRKEESASATMAQMFLQERLAMHISGRWLVPKYRQDAKFDWDVVQFPRGEKGSIVPLDSSGWAVSKDSKHKSEALKLIKFLSSEKNMQKFTESGLIVPARVEVANSKIFLNGKPNNSKAFLTTIETSVPTPVTTNYNEILDDMQIKNEYLFNK